MVNVNLLINIATLSHSRKYYEEEEAAAIAAEEAAAARAAQRSAESVDESGFPASTSGERGNEYDANDGPEGRQQLATSSSRRQRGQQGKASRMSASGRRQVEDVEECLGGEEEEDGGKREKMEKKGGGSRRMGDKPLDQEEYYGFDSAEMGRGEKEIVPGDEGPGAGGRKTMEESSSSRKVKSKDRVPSIDGLEGSTSLGPRRGAAVHRPPAAPTGRRASSAVREDSDDELM